jgi:hypothetical protein
MPRSSKWSLPFRFSNQNVVFLITTMHATCPTHLILDLIRGSTIPLRIFCEKPVTEFLKLDLQVEDGTPSIFCTDEISMCLWF